MFSFYLISPYHKIYKLYNSIKKSDTEFVSKNIDWVNVKSGFKDDFKNIVNKAYSQTNSLEKKILGNLFIQIIIETLVDNLVTPKYLILLVNDPDKYKKILISVDWTRAELLSIDDHWEYINPLPTRAS